MCGVLRRGACLQAPHMSHFAWEFWVGNFATVGSRPKWDMQIARCLCATKVGHSNVPLRSRTLVQGWGRRRPGRVATPQRLAWVDGMVWHGMVCCIGNDSCFRRPCVVGLSSGYRSGTTQRSGTTSHSSFISSHDHDGAMMRSCARRTALLSYALHARTSQTALACAASRIDADTARGAHRIEPATQPPT